MPTSPSWESAHGLELVRPNCRTEPLVVRHFRHRTRAEPSALDALSCERLRRRHARSARRSCGCTPPRRDLLRAMRLVVPASQGAPARQLGHAARAASPRSCSWRRRAACRCVHGLAFYGYEMARDRHSAGSVLHGVRRLLGTHRWASTMRGWQRRVRGHEAWVGPTSYLSAVCGRFEVAGAARARVARGGCNYRGRRVPRGCLPRWLVFSRGSCSGGRSGPDSDRECVSECGIERADGRNS